MDPPCRVRGRGEDVQDAGPAGDGRAPQPHVQQVRAGGLQRADPLHGRAAGGECHRRRAHRLHNSINARCGLHLMIQKAMAA